jgi:DNA-binding NarL/FixJ family response regulator
LKTAQLDVVRKADDGEINTTKLNPQHLPEGGRTGPCSGRTTIVIVDDHTLFREGLREILLTEHDFDVVGLASDGDEGLDVVGRCHPDVLLLDIEMPHHQVKRTVPQFLRVSPRTRIIILTMYDDPQLANELINLGAQAYLVKSATRAELVSVIRGVCSDERRVVVSMSRRRFRQLADDREQTLTRRQKEILGLAAQAMSNAQIANRLYITENTVKRHLSAVYAELGAVSRVDAINKARAAALIPPVEAGWDGANRDT